MNVFVLSRDHEERARYHCDVHVSKMLLESAQILNTALHLNNADERRVFYSPTHNTHPWTEWAADRYANWEWLFDHATALGEEFLRRSEKESHATINKMEDHWVEPFDGREHRNEYLNRQFDDGPRDEFPVCTGDFEPESNNVVEAYREYYVAEKVPQDWATWTNEVPEWVLEMQ